MSRDIKNTISFLRFIIFGFILFYETILFSSPISQELDVKDFFLVHATRKFPDNNLLVASNSIRMPGREDNPSKIMYLSPDQAPPQRISLHFTLNHLVLDHEEGKWADCPYVLMIPLKDALEHIYGGYAEDIILLGPYAIPSSSTLLMPSDELENPSTKQFQGNIVPYERGKEAMRDAVKNQLHQLGAHHVEIKDLETLEYQGRNFKHLDFLSCLKSKLPHFQPLYHGVSHLFAIEYAIQSLSQPFYRIAAEKKDTFLESLASDQDFSCYLSVLKVSFNHSTQSIGDSAILKQKLLAWQEALLPWKRLWEQEHNTRIKHGKSFFSSYDLLLELINKRKDEKLIEKTTADLAKIPSLSSIKTANMEGVLGSFIPSYQALMNVLEEWKKREPLDFLPFQLFYLIKRPFYYTQLSSSLMQESPDDLSQYLQKDFQDVQPQEILKKVCVNALKDVFDGTETEKVECLNVINHNKVLKSALRKFLEYPEVENRDISIEDLKKLGAVPLETS